MDTCIYCLSPITPYRKIGIQVALADDIIIVCIPCVAKMSCRVYLQQLVTHAMDVGYSIGQDMARKVERKKKLESRKESNWKATQRRKAFKVVATPQQISDIDSPQS